MTKNDFTIHTADTAPAPIRETLAKVRERYGFLPNFFGVAAEAPAAVEAYLAIHDAFGRTSLTAVEQQVVILTVSVQNRCNYCAAAHTMSAERTGVDAEIIAAIREGRPIAEPKLEALRTLTARLVETAGWVSEADIQAFLQAGYSRAQVLEVLVGVALKTLSNYTNHIADTPLDAPLAPKALAKAG